MAITTISISTTFSDILTYTLANSNYLDSQKKYKCITFTRDLAAAAGDVSYTGAGFKPNSIVFFSALSGVGVSWGLSCNKFTVTGSKEIHAYDLAPDLFHTFDTVIGFGSHLSTDPYTSGVVKSFDNDGFTLTWYKFGSGLLVGTATCIALCIR